MRPFTYKRTDEVDKAEAAVGPDRMPPPMAATQFLADGAAVTHRADAAPAALPRRWQRSMTLKLSDLPGYLSDAPLFWPLATLLAYQVASAIYVRSTLNPIFNPVTGQVTFIISLLLLTGTHYRTYFDGAQLLHSMLGPAWRSRSMLRSQGPAANSRVKTAMRWDAAAQLALVPSTQNLRKSSWYVRRSPAWKGCRHRLRKVTAFLPCGAG